MKVDWEFLERIFWGVLLIIIAAALVVVWAFGFPFLMVVPLAFLGIGGWMIITGGSFYRRAWGIVLALVGGLWLVRGYYMVSMYIVVAVFLVVVGLLVIIGSRSEKSTG